MSSIQNSSCKLHCCAHNKSTSYCCIISRHGKGSYPFNVEIIIIHCTGLKRPINANFLCRHRLETEPAQRQIFSYVVAHPLMRRQGSNPHPHMHTCPQTITVSLLICAEFDTRWRPYFRTPSYHIQTRIAFALTVVFSVCSGTFIHCGEKA
jgi:hypothetical protein